MITRKYTSKITLVCSVLIFRAFCQGVVNDESDDLWPGLWDSICNQEPASYNGALRFLNLLPKFIKAPLIEFLSYIHCLNPGQLCGTVPRWKLRSNLPHLPAPRQISSPAPSATNPLQMVATRFLIHFISSSDLIELQSTRAIVMSVTVVALRVFHALENDLVKHAALRRQNATSKQPAQDV